MGAPPEEYWNPYRVFPQELVVLKPFQSAASSALTVCTFLLASCGGSGDNSSTLNLGLTDAPVSGVTQVWIEFSGVELKPVNGNPIDFTFNPEKGFDLLTLQGGTT